MGQQVMNASRALYSDLKGKYGRRSGVIITDSFLFLMKSIQSTVTTVNFDVLTNSSSGTPPTVIERRLNISDKFVVRDHAICLMKAGTTTAATQAEINVGVPRTYPNGSVFSGASEAANLQAVYNGYCTVIINSVVYYQALDIRRFYRVPTSQKGVAVSTVATTGVIGDDGWDILNYAFSPVQPQFELDGTGNNQLSVTIGNPTSLIGTNSQNFLCWMLRGFLVQNINQRS
jgi:hypothetical protein